MTMHSLGEGQTGTLPAGGMFQIQAHALGRITSVELEIRGAATVNRVDPATVKVIDVTGDADIVLRPIGGGDFGPGCAAQVVLSRGRPGSAAAEAVELPRITLDGRGEVLAGTLGRADANLCIRAAAAASGRLEGPAATVRAGLRSAIDGGRLDFSGVRAIRLHLDCSASMSAPSVRELLPAAVAVVVGAAGVIPAAPPVTVHDPDGAREVAAGDLSAAVATAVAAGAGRVGGAEDICRGPAELVFIISDAVPAAVASGAVPAVALLPAGGRAGRSAVVVDATLAADLDAGRMAGAEAVVAAIAEVVAAGAAADTADRGARR